MSDFRPVEANKARILGVQVLPPGRSGDELNAEWVEIAVNQASDLGNWRLQRLCALWRAEVSRPVEWQWVYTFGSPAFVQGGEIYRIHSGSRIRAAGHPTADDQALGRKHVYAAGPVANARPIWERGDYVRLVDAFGTVIDEVVVWPADEPEAQRAAPAAR